MVQTLGAPMKSNPDLQTQMPEGDATTEQMSAEGALGNSIMDIPKPALKENPPAPIETKRIPKNAIAPANHPNQMPTTNNATDISFLFHVSESYKQVNIKGWTPNAITILLKLSDQLAHRSPPPKISPISPYIDEDVFMAEQPHLPNKPSIPKKPITMKKSEVASTTSSKSSLISCIAAASTQALAIVTSVDANRVIVPMFIQEPFPIIHISHPMAPLDYIKPSQITKWERMTSAKLLIIPFDMELNDLVIHSSVANQILQVVYNFM